MRTQFPILALASVLLACQAGAQVLPDEPSTADGSPAPTVTTSPTPRAQVERLLSAYHGLPTEQALSVVPDVEAVLWSIVDDPAALGFHRERALLSLRYFPSAALRARLEQMLGEATGESLLEHDAIALYGGMYRDDAAVAVLAALIAAEDEQIGLGAVEALRLMQQASADAALRDASTLPLTPLVLEAIQAAVEPR